jgi:hypothetical protein
MIGPALDGVEEAELVAWATELVALDGAAAGFEPDEQAMSVAASAATGMINFFMRSPCAVGESHGQVLLQAAKSIAVASGTTMSANRLIRCAVLYGCLRASRTTA